MPSLKRSICVVTSSRSDYGLLRPILKLLFESDCFIVQLVVTGSHLSPDHGLTIKEVEKDHFPIAKSLEILLSSDTSSATSKSIGLALLSFADAFKDLKPDLLLLLGDRFEILAAAVTATCLGIPIAHCHGGEVTQAAFDDAFRHSITKMSQLHFVATDDYRKRVIQLGENPDTVFNVGGLGIDSILSLNLLSKAEISDRLKLTFRSRNLLITYHPVTLEVDSSTYQFKQLLDYLASLSNTSLIFTMPNADPSSRDLVGLVKSFCHTHHNAYYYNSLGQLNYFSCIQFVDAVVGNSSSGLLEVPSFMKGTINIGNRQHGRIKASSVIDCSCSKESLTSAFNRLYSNSFQEDLLSTINPYGTGGAADKIYQILSNVDFNNHRAKKFFDIPFDL